MVRDIGMDSRARVVIYEIDGNDCLVAVNEAWAVAAREGQAEFLIQDAVLQHSLWDFVRDRETRMIYDMLFLKVRGLQTFLDFEYRCDTPYQRRLMQMELHAGDDDHICLINTILRQEERPYTRLLDPMAVRSDEFLNICSWCKQVELATLGIWVEIEEAVQHFRLFDSPVLPQLSHGICPDCRVHFMDKGRATPSA